MGIPVTTPALTIADLRRVVPVAVLRRAIRQAEFLGLAVGNAPEADRTRSELERRFLRLCRRHRLPTPTVNARVGRFAVDFLWPDHRLVAETDGFRHHRGRQAFEDDRARDVELQLGGHRVVRSTHQQVVDNPARVVAVLSDLLSVPVPRL